MNIIISIINHSVLLFVSFSYFFAFFRICVKYNIMDGTEFEALACTLQKINFFSFFLLRSLG